MSLVSTTMKVTSALVIFASATGLALAGGYKGESYKGESVVAPCPQPCMLKDGFYVGAQVGYDSYRVRQTVTLAAPVVVGINPVLNATGWVGGLFLGYGQYMSDYFYLGGEIFGNASDARTSWAATAGAVSYTTSVRARGSWGLALLPGVRLNDTSLGYIRLGWNWVSLRARETLTAISDIARTNTSNGFNYGVGIETLLYDMWSVRAEYSHTGYTNFTSNNTIVGTSTRFNPSDNQFMLGLIYHFA